MQPLERAVARLIQKIEAPEQKTDSDPKLLARLQAVQKGLSMNNQTALETGCMLLRDHWLNSVAWCSDLSREIEKILILYDEMRDG